MAQIVCLRGPLAGQHFAFDSSHVSFGRTSDNTIQIASRLASRQHASISREEIGYVLRDNDSRNGSRVNGEYTSYRVLRSGDEITIGEEVFRFEDTSAAGDCTQVPRPTGTVTFLFTDVADSTILWDQHPAPMRLAMMRHDELIEQIVVLHDGVLVRPRGEGDSRFAVFARASDAIAAACEIQQAFRTELWPATTPICVRMGLHTGEADLRDGDYYGSAVNRCARVRAMAEGGQTLLSLATFVLARDSLAMDVKLRDLGEHPLRGLRYPERVFELLLDARQALTATAA